jgi:hypothetical protein
LATETSSERQPRLTARVKASIILLFLLLSLLYGRAVIQNDGLTYYALTLSLLDDHDFDLTNQLSSIPEIRTVWNPVTQKMVPVYSCGFAVLYAPFLWASRTIASIYPAMAAWRPYGQNVRFAFQDGLGIFLGSVCFSLAAVFISIRLLIQRYWASNGTAGTLAMLVFLGTPLMYYTFCVPSFTHAADSFLVATSFYLAVLPKHLEFTKVRGRNLLLGFFLALSMLIRNNNIILVPPIVGGLLFFERKEGWKRAIVTCFEIFAGALPILLIHAHFNWTQYGKVFTTGYRMNLSEAISLSGSTPYRLYSLLGDPATGMFVWAPLTILSMIGFIFGIRRRNWNSALALICITLVILSIQFFGFVNPGAAFGQRFLLHLYVFYVVGLFELFLVWKRATIVAASIFTLWAFLLMNCYLINLSLPYFRAALPMEAGRTVGAQELLWNLSSGLQKLKQAGTPVSLSRIWWDSLRARPYPTLLFILMDDVQSRQKIEQKQKKRKKRV